ncbi:acyl transferase/acyl hydrolase/lysophospholipase [Rhizoctonia solani]|nr:acyl transferase/acyl hydrolase/lysophospholipase [Rhizoctonia solani]
MAFVNAVRIRSVLGAGCLSQIPLRRATYLGPLTAKSLIHSYSNPSHPSDAPDEIIPPVSLRDQSGAQPLRILSLDGGGVRGLSSLIIFREFIARLEKTPGVTKPVIPADFFDLIVGTSTGGIMALMLGRLRMSVDEVLDMYLTLSKQVFHTGRVSTAAHACATMFMDGVPSMYDEIRLEKIVKQTIAKRIKDQDTEALLEDLSPNSCRTAVVTARSADATRPILMRSYAVPHDADPERFKIWEAARATSAAPLYFRPMKAGVYKVPYLDGCVSGHCNPTWLAMQEVKHLWPDRKIGLFMSLGTGSPTRVALQAPVRRFILGFVHLSANTVQIHEMAWREFKRKYAVSPYVRLSVDHEISKVRLDDPSMLDNITAASLTYSRSHELPIKSNVV